MNKIIQNVHFLEKGSKLKSSRDIRNCSLTERYLYSPVEMAAPIFKVTRNGAVG